MKKEKVIALLLTTVMSLSVAAPAAAADFTDDTADVVIADTEISDSKDTESPDISQEQDSETEVIVEDSVEDYEEEDTFASEDEIQAAGEDAQIAVFSDGTTGETTEGDKDTTNVQIPVDISYNGGLVTGATIPAQNKPLRYRITLPNGGCLTLKLDATKHMSGKLIEVKGDKETDLKVLKTFEIQEKGSFEASYELAQGTYYVELCGDYEETDDKKDQTDDKGTTDDNGNSDSGNTDNGNTVDKGTYNFKTSFTTEGATSFPETANDSMATASPISVGQNIKGHLALNNTDDYYKIVIPTNGKYTFRYRSSDRKVRFQHFLYNAAFQEIKRNDITYAGSDVWELGAGTYYYRITKSPYEEYGFYTMSVVNHTHTYQTSSILRATLKSNGSINKRCSGCGDIISTAISKPAHVVLSTTNYTYSGGEKKPSVKVTDMNGAVIPSSAYTVVYDVDTKSSGKHGVKVTFKGKYSGSTTRYYNIKPKNTSITKTAGGFKSFAIRIQKQPVANVTGYQVQYSLYKNFKSAKTKTFYGTYKKVTNLKKKKYYYVRIRTYKKVGTGRLYSSWSSAKKIKTK